jgi:hypothetical protein
LRCNLEIPLRFNQIIARFLDQILDINITVIA